MKKLLSKIRAAIEKYDMIAADDNIAVGISGGKDSLVLLVLLHELQKFYNKSFNLTAITVDHMFDQRKEDLSLIKEFTDKLGIKYVVKHVNIYDIVFNKMKERNPCSLCSKLRGGILHNLALENGCNKVALGHHSDDVIETFLMNLLYGGKISCFAAKSYLSRKQIYLIRPMIFFKEKEISLFANKLNLPILTSRCTKDKNSSRQVMKDFVKQLETKFPQAGNKIFTACKSSILDKGLDKTQ